MWWGGWWGGRGGGEEAEVVGAEGVESARGGGEYVRRLIDGKREIDTLIFVRRLHRKDLSFESQGTTDFTFARNNPLEQQHLYLFQKNQSGYNFANY